MIVLNVTYKCKPGKAKEFFDSVRKEGIDESSRAEEGNIRYEYYFPAEGGDELLLMEKWKDTEAFASHGQQPHFKRLGELKAEYVNETVIDKFEV